MSQTSVAQPPRGAWRRPAAWRAIGLALLALTAAVVLTRGLLLTRYDPPTSDAYLWGAFHVHSSRSDGVGSLEDIASQARAARVSFLLMSEHGSPHETAVESTTVEGVRFIGGSEVGLPEGRLIVSDLERLPRHTLPPYPPHAVRDTREWGGMAVLAYPEDPRYRWSYWDEDFRPDGIEIINVTSYFRAAPFWRRLTWTGFSLFNRHYYITSLTSPSYALGRWDELLTRGRVVGLYASNAHGGFDVTDRLSVPVPSYRTALGFVGLGVDRRHSNDLERAVRDGDFFSVVRSAGEPDRFEFGHTADDHVRLGVEASEELSTRLVLKRDGQVVADTNEPTLEQPARPGIYRAEIYLHDHPLLSADVPWILSNPVYVGVVDEALPTTPTCENRAPVDLAEFQLETDDESTGSLRFSPTGALTLSYHLSQATPDEPERWVALAIRRPFDLTAYRGLYIEGRTGEPMRYRVELRTSTRSYHATALIQNSPGATVPWRQFYAMGGGRETVGLADIESLFIEVTDATARTGFDSTLSLDEVGFCRQP